MPARYDIGTSSYRDDSFPIGDYSRPNWVDDADEDGPPCYICGGVGECTCPDDD